MKKSTSEMRNALFSFFFLTLVSCLCTGFPVQAQDSHTTNSDRRWYAPDHLVLQFAGNLGLVSGGIGYSYFKDHLHTDVSYGFTPPFDKRHTAIHSLNVKNTYRVFQIKLDPDSRYVLVPLRVGFGLTYSFGPQFETFWPQKYPDMYYPFPTSIRLLPYIGMAVSRSLNDGRTAFKRIRAIWRPGHHRFRHCCQSRKRKSAPGRHSEHRNRREGGLLIRGFRAPSGLLPDPPGSRWPRPCHPYGPRTIHFPKPPLPVDAFPDPGP